MKVLSGFLAVIVVSTLGMSSVAQARGYGHGDGYGKYLPQHRFEKRVDRRQDRQWDRIQDGIDSGELTRREARRLMRGQRRIERMENRFERDGYISPREQRKLERALNRNSKRIKRAKHNDHPGYGYRSGWKDWPHRHYVERYAYPWPDYSNVSDSSLGSFSIQRGEFTLSWYPSN